MILIRLSFCLYCDSKFYLNYRLNLSSEKNIGRSAISSVSNPFCDAIFTGM